MNPQIEILLVADSINDSLPVLRFLKDKVSENIIHLSSGKDAIDYIFHSDTFPPTMILFDNNMSGIDGFMVLKLLKTNNEKKKIPVVMLTTSQEETDILESFAFGANGYIIKPVGYNKLVDAVKHLELF